MAKALRFVKFILLAVAIPVSILTVVMSYDVARIRVDPSAVAGSLETQIIGAERVSSFGVDIRNEGYLFSLSDTSLTVIVLDANSRGIPLGTGTSIFSIGPGENHSGRVSVRMSNDRYEQVREFDVEVKIDGSLALGFANRKITFVTFNIVSSLLER